MIVKSDRLNLWIIGTQPATVSGLKVYVETNFPGCKVNVSNGMHRLNGEDGNFESIVVIYDIPLFEKSTLDSFSSELQKSGKLMPIVFVDNPRVYNVWQLLNSGAKGILNKQESLEYLKSCIISVVNGGFYFSQNLLTGLIDPLIKKPSNSFLALSRRQQLILDLISKGYRTGDISRELKLYPSTVSSQKKIIFDKLGIVNSLELQTYEGMQS
jgi:DNA-binding NarL/FixJ family response regulator